MSITYVNIGCEDILSEAVLRTMIYHSGRSFQVNQVYRRGGAGYLRKAIRGFNSASRYTPYVVLADLDANECAIKLIEEWLPEAHHPNLVFRVAVREVEAWLLADRVGFAGFLGVSRDTIPQDVDGIWDPKAFLISLASRSRRRELRRDIVPQEGSLRVQGPNYNGRLISFVEHRWDIDRAALVSNSLQRAVKALRAFRPQL